NCREEVTPHTYVIAEGFKNFLVHKEHQRSGKNGKCDPDPCQDNCGCHVQENHKPKNIITDVNKEINAQIAGKKIVHGELFAQIQLSVHLQQAQIQWVKKDEGTNDNPRKGNIVRSEEHTSELQSRENLVCR